MISSSSSCELGPGPYEECKVYENVAQCAGGAASTTGFRDNVPMVTGAQIGDSGTGLHLGVGAAKRAPPTVQRVGIENCNPNRHRGYKNGNAYPNPVCHLSYSSERSLQLSL